jgi:hypothetical protein
MKKGFGAVLPKAFGDFGSPAIMALWRQTRGFASPTFDGFAFFDISVTVRLFYRQICGRL